MKLSKRQLRRIIREEKQKLLKEGNVYSDGSYAKFGEGFFKFMKDGDDEGMKDMISRFGDDFFKEIAKSDSKFFPRKLEDLEDFSDEFPESIKYLAKRLNDMNIKAESTFQRGRTLSKRQLRRIIREEKFKLIKEGWNYGGWDGSYGGSVREGSDVMELVGEQLAQLGVEAPPEFWQRLNSYINDVERAAKR